MDGRTRLHTLQVGHVVQFIPQTYRACADTTCVVNMRTGFTFKSGFGVFYNYNIIYRRSQATSVLH